MKKWFYVIALSSLIFAGCKKDDDCKAAAPTTIASSTETAELQNYLTIKAISATQKNGMFYVINSQGSGTSPNICSTITVDYVGSLMNTSTGTDGAQFDASQPNQPLVTPLNNLIAGWQLVFPLIKAGGTATLYIPPSLGYGNSAQPGLPANSYLKFVITLKAVK